MVTEQDEAVRLDEVTSIGLRFGGRGAGSIHAQDLLGEKRAVKAVRDHEYTRGDKQ